MDPLPKNTNGEVIIHPKALFINEDKQGNEYVVNRASVVFHELDENYQRTEKKLPYLYLKPNSSVEDMNKPGAHRVAIKDAEKLIPGAKEQTGKEGRAKDARIQDSKTLQ
jgi:hypothetical protein